jgi:hypothetical protein
MKTYKATLYVTIAQDVSVQASTPEEAKWLMLNSFNRNLAECRGETDIEEFEEVNTEEGANE